MKLFKISQTVNQNYDTYDSAVVVAESAEDAQKIHPAEIEEPAVWWLNVERYWDWAYTLDQVKVEYIGETHLTAGTVVCASFNAG